jgi:hypothetical protein
MLIMGGPVPQLRVDVLWTNQPASSETKKYTVVFAPEESDQGSSVTRDILGGESALQQFLINLNAAVDVRTWIAEVHAKGSAERTLDFNESIADLFRTSAGKSRGTEQDTSPLYRNDIVEVIATKRRGKIGESPDDLPARPGVTRTQRWRVEYSDGGQPPLEYFVDRSKLRLVGRPQGNRGGSPGFYPDRGIMG